MTAIDFLIEQIRNNKFIGASEQIEVIYAAKEMEKQQIMYAFYDGKSNGMDISHNLSSTKEITSEQYYNETYKNTEL